MNKIHAVKAFNWALLMFVLFQSKLERLPVFKIQQRDVNNF